MASCEIHIIENFLQSFPKKWSDLLERFAARLSRIPLNTTDHEVPFPTQTSNLSLSPSSSEMSSLRAGTVVSWMDFTEASVVFANCSKSETTDFRVATSLRSADKVGRPFCCCIVFSLFLLLFFYFFPTICVLRFLYHFLSDQSHIWPVDR